MTPGYSDPKQYDPWDEAMIDEPVRFAGRVTIDVSTVVLIAGQGKVEYDEAVHKGLKTSTMIEFVIEPLDPTRKLIEITGKRAPLSWSPEYKSVIRPSIEALADRLAEIRHLEAGQFNQLRALNGLWVIGQYVPKPTNKAAVLDANGNIVTAAETWTTIKFTAVYGSEEECREAYDPDSAPAPADPQRVAMAAFLPALWAQAGKDANKFHALIASNPLLANQFNAQSVEVMAIEAGI